MPSILATSTAATGAADALLGLPATTLTATDAALGDIVDEDTGAWTQALRHVTGVDARIRLLEALLTRRLAAGVQPAPMVTAAVAAWDAYHGRPSVADMVERTGYSRRRFTDLFRDAVGIPPKTYARLRRFQHAIGCIRESDGIGWPELALACGYCDQAHLIQEFREFAGVTPAAYAAARLPERNHIPT
ncbi:helix-turn-helix transcriptional regulator [Arhodomonas sp. AD133]|uniref:helix-turn-helix transcriptional regulator n=1 Tax=Arhodomonas sp. AD133 TaxID=3415009 RepID=UPI003EC0EA22